MNIVYATNDAFVHLTATSIKSLLAHNQSVHLYIFYTNLSDKNINKLHKMIKIFNIKTTFVQIDINKLSDFKVRYHLTIESYLRFFIPNYISYPKVLYIDGDTIIMSSIQDLYDININDVYLGAVTSKPIILDRKVKELSLKSGKYFNSGIMLINLKKIKEDSIFDKSIDFMHENPDLIEYADQDALNKIIDGRYLELDIKYNATHFNLNEFESNSKPVIVHFIGSIKPDDLKSKHPYKKEFIRILKKTPFYSPFNVKINRLKWHKRIFKNLIKSSIVQKLYQIEFIKFFYIKLFKKRNGNIK